jgi:hypothetical protein
LEAARINDAEAGMCSHLLAWVFWLEGALMAGWEALESARDWLVDSLQRSWNDLMNDLRELWLWGRPWVDRLVDLLEHDCVQFSLYLGQSVLRRHPLIFLTTGALGAAGGIAAAGREESEADATLEVGSVWDDFIDVGSRYDSTLRGDLGYFAKATVLMDTGAAIRSFAGCVQSL